MCESSIGCRQVDLVDPAAGTTCFVYLISSKVAITNQSKIDSRIFNYTSNNSTIQRVNWKVGKTFFIKSSTSSALHKLWNCMNFKT